MSLKARQDYTILESYHGGNYLIFCHISRKVNSSNTVFTLGCTYLVGQLSTSLVEPDTVVLRFFCWYLILPQWSGPIQKNEGAALFHAGLMSA